MKYFVPGYQVFLALCLFGGLAAALLSEAPYAWWGVVVAAVPMALHFTLRLSFKPRPRTRWLMPQQVITLGGLGITLNPDIVGEPNVFALALTCALVIGLYVYLIKVWRADLTKGDGA
jgi:hypothetical protein